MKSSLLKIIVIISILLAMSLLNNTVFADLAQGGGGGSSSSDKNFDYEQYVPSNPNDSDIPELQKIGSTVVGIVRGVGIIASVATLIVLGIKYMAGSVEERAQYKKTMIPYVIGAFMVFAITFFLSIVIDIAKQI